MDTKTLREQIIALHADRLRESRFRTRGMSMDPLLCDGDEIEIGGPLGPVRFGDIILFNGDTGLVAHRVIGLRRLKDETLIHEKGDRSSRATWISASRVLGRAVRLHRGDRVIRLDTPRSRLVGRVMALYSLSAYGVLTLLPSTGSVSMFSRLSARLLRFLGSLLTRGARSP